MDKDNKRKMEKREDNYVMPKIKKVTKKEQEIRDSIKKFLEQKYSGKSSTIDFYQKILNLQKKLFQETKDEEETINFIEYSKNCVGNWI